MTYVNMFFIETCVPRLDRWKKVRRTTAGTPTEAALTRDLSADLREAWEPLRETAASLGEQRIYASHQSIMFSRKSCQAPGRSGDALHRRRIWDT
jgi:hypothetical protein